MDRELLVARICSGSMRVRVGETTYYIRSPGREAAYSAAELYQEQLQEAQFRGLYDEQELLVFLLEEGLWDEERQKLLEKLPKEIEEFKLSLFKATFKTKERQVIRKALGMAKERLASLEAERHSHDYLSAKGLALIAKHRFILACSIYSKNGQPLFPEESYWEDSGQRLDAISVAYAALRLEEKVYRDLARNEPWRSLWQCRKAEGSVFGISPIDYTEEQRNLVAYASMYDSVFEHPECPGDEVIEDDDMMDGWLIHQRREREARLGKKSGDDILSDKMKSSQEVYLIADTAQDAERVMGMNDEHSRSVQKQRFEHLRKKGVVNELDMPDTAARLRMEAVQKIHRDMKGGK